MARPMTGTDRYREQAFPGESGPLARLWRRIPISLEPVDDLMQIFSFPDACPDREGWRTSPEDQA